MRRTLIIGLITLAACGQSAAEKRAKEALKKQEAEAVAKKKADAEAEKNPKPKDGDAVKLGSPWDDGKLITSEGPCPEGLWSLFKGDAPGADKAAKKASEAKRDSLAKEVKSQVFLVKLRSDAVKLKDFDAPKGVFPVEVAGSIECTDDFGHVSIAWTAAKAGDPGNSAAKQDSEVTQRYWIAPPLEFTIPMKSMAEAKEWKNTKGIGLSARVVFKLGKVEVDKKIHKVAKVTEKAAGETISLGGGDEDWGAGRMVRAEGVSVRVAVDREKTELFTKKE